MNCKNPRRFFDLVLIVVFVVCIVSPFVCHILTPDAGVSESEKRRLASLPAVPDRIQDARKYLSDMEAYLNDHFGFRSLLLFAGNAAKYRLGFQVTPDVLTGKDGWLFLAKLNSVVEQYQGLDLFTAESLREWVEEMECRRKWLSRLGIEFVVVVPPSKHTIYEEYLPDRIRIFEKKTRLDQLLSYAGQHSDLTIVDLRAELIDAKSSFQLYMKTDSHWNEFGGYVGYRELMKYVHKRIPETDVVDFENLRDGERIDLDTDLAQMLNLAELIKEPFPTLLPARGLLAKPVAKERKAKNGRNPARFFTTNRDNLANAVVFHDSFIWGMHRLLLETFNETALVHHGGGRFDKDIVLEERPDIVIYELAERSINLALEKSGCERQGGIAAEDNRKEKGPSRPVDPRRPGSGA